MPDKNIGEQTRGRPTETGESAAKAPAPAAHGRRKRWAAPLGFLMLVLAAVGFITLVSAGTKLFFKLTDNTAKKEAYARMLNPIVMLDVPDFEDPSEISSTLVLQTTVWSIFQKEDIERFKNAETGIYLIPVPDLIVECARLYGPGAQILRQSMSADGGDIALAEEGSPVFEYVEEYDSFAVPVLGEIGEYKPKVEKIKKSAGTLTLTVGYCPLGSWYDTYAEDKGGQTAEKYKLFTLKKGSSGNYFIQSQEDVDYTPD